MSKKHTMIRRKGEPTRAEQRQTREENEASPDPRPARRPPVLPTQQSTLAPAVDTDALLAITTMDPDELGRLMELGGGRRDWSVGDRVIGKVTRVGKDQVLVDVGGKGDAILALSDLVQEPPELGDEIEAFVTWVEPPDVGLSQKLASGGLGALEAAHESGMPVEGKVLSKNSGGFEVMVGQTRAFCPASHISRLRSVDLDSYVGQTLQFRVIEVDPKLVISRRVLQEAEIEKTAQAFWDTVEVGTVYGGVVRNVQPFGVFVDVQGVDGLVPNRELGWGSGSGSVSVGQHLEVRVLEVDKDAQKLTLSAKDPDLSPWNRVGTEFEVGGIHTGKVTKVTDFGAFVELVPGLEGLAHSSKFPEGLPKAGASLDVRILDIDPGRQRLSLSPAIGEATDDAPDTEVTGVVLEVRHGGVSIQLDDGRSGWLPAAEVDLPAGTVLAQRFRRGKRVTTWVVAVDRGDTLRLTQRERTEERGWRQDLARQENTGFGTMAALLQGLKDQLD